VRRILANRYVLALLLILAVGAEFGVASESHPVALAAGTGTAASARAVVTSVVRACPAPGSTGPTAGGIAVATASAGTGQAQVSRLSPVSAAAPGPAVNTIATPGRAVQAAIPAAPVLGRSLSAGTAATASQVATGPARGGVMVQATGGMARGLEVEQTGPDGVATARCGGPGTDFWFVGPGQHSVADIQLYLMDTDNQPATAEVDVDTDSGPLLGSTDTGIAVPAHGLVVQSLANLVRNSRVLALHISTSVGRVVAAVRETASAAKPGAWLPAAQPPATSLVLPGVPGSAGTRQLYVAVPGAGNAQIKLTAVTAKGSYQPTGGNGIDLPGGSAVEVALPSLGGIAGAVRVTSNVPVTAAMSVPGGGAGAPGAFTAASAPVQEQGVLSGNTGASASLVLSARGCQGPGRRAGRSTRDGRQHRAHRRRAQCGGEGQRADRFCRECGIRSGGHAVAGLRAGLCRAGAQRGHRGALDPAGGQLADLGSAPCGAQLAADRPAWRSVIGVARIDSLGVDAEQPREFLDDHVENQLS
jgi:hypothetical protein